MVKIENWLSYLNENWRRLHEHVQICVWATFSRQFLRLREIESKEPHFQAYVLLSSTQVDIYKSYAKNKPNSNFHNRLYDANI